MLPSPSNEAAEWVVPPPFCATSFTLRSLSFSCTAAAVLRAVYRSALATNLGGQGGHKLLAGRRHTLRWQAGHAVHEHVDQALAVCGTHVHSTTVCLTQAATPTAHVHARACHTMGQHLGTYGTQRHLTNTRGGS